jgi:hypothetical protein
LDVDKFLKNTLNAAGISAASVAVYDSKSQSFENINAGFIAPFQAFFVHPLSVSAAVQLRITETMLGANKGTELRGLNAPDNTLRIRAKQGAYTSLDAVVTAKDGASNSFDINEDAVKLFSSESPLEVTTMIDGMALGINNIDCNALNELSIPINIKSTKAGVITLEIDGAIGFLAADNIFLYDSQTGISTSLLETSTFIINKDNTEDVNGRFFLQFIKEEKEEKPLPTYINDVALSALYIGAQKGNVLVQSRDEKILNVIVFDVAGRKVLEAGNINSTAYSNELPCCGAYMVKVVTDKQVKTGKIIIK